MGYHAPNAELGEEHLVREGMTLSEITDTVYRLDQGKIVSPV